MGVATCTLHPGERHRLHPVDVHILPRVADVVFDDICPLICLRFRVGHQSVSNPGTEDLETLLLLHYPPHCDYVPDVDQSLGGVALVGGLLVLVELHHHSVSLGGVLPQDVPSFPILRIRERREGGRDSGTTLKNE